ncbi:hypothetical protein Tco_1048682 [Tanacetum coccineum]
MIGMAGNGGDVVVDFGYDMAVWHGMVAAVVLFVVAAAAVVAGGGEWRSAPAVVAGNLDGKSDDARNLSVSGKTKTLSGMSFYIKLL